MPSKQEQKVQDTIRRIIADSKKTGRVMNVRILKADIAEHFPELGANELFSFLPQEFQLESAPMKKVPVGELKDLCLAKPDHPLSSIFRAAVLGKKDDRLVAVLLQDYNALKEDAAAPEE